MFESLYAMPLIAVVNSLLKVRIGVHAVLRYTIHVVLMLHFVFSVKAKLLSLVWLIFYIHVANSNKTCKKPFVIYCTIFLQWVHFLQDDKLGQSNI